MRATYQTALLALPLLLSAMLLTACNRGGVLGQSSSATGDSSQQQQQQPAKAAGAQPQNTEPQASVDGTPSADSDRGSPSAVAHRSVAQPSAPQGSLPQDQHATPPAASRPAHP